MIIGGNIINILTLIIALLIVLKLIKDTDLWFKIMFVIGMMYALGTTFLYAGISIPYSQELLISIEYVGIPVLVMYYFYFIEKYFGKYAQYFSMAIGGVGGMLLGSGLKNVANMLPAITGGLINTEMAKIIATNLAFIHLVLIGIGIYLGYLFYKEYQPPFETSFIEGKHGGGFKLPKLPSLTLGKEKHAKLKL